jgi:hypothetical protein
MAMRKAKASNFNVTAEIQEEGIFEMTLELVMENPNGGISMKFGNAKAHKWANNRLETERAMESMDSTADALGLETWDDSNPVKSFSAAIGRTCNIQIQSKKSNGTTYYNVVKFSKIEAKPAAAKTGRAAKASDKPYQDGDIPF